MAGAGRGRVVVADGDGEVRRLLRVKLGAAGFEVVEAASAAEVRLAAARQVPDVLLCEGRLADGTAAELLAQLRAAPGGDRLAIVVLDELGTDRDIEAALAAGADDVVAKPFSPSEVVLRIRVAVARRDVRPAPAAAPGPQAAAAPLDSSADGPAESGVAVEAGAPPVGSSGAGPADPAVEAGTGSSW